MTKSEKEKYELIEKFIENTLSKEEQEIFNTALKNDPEFALEVGAHKEVHGLLLDQGILTIKEKLRKIHYTETKGSNYKLYASIAAIVLTAGILLYFYNSSKTNEVKVKEPVSQTTTTPSNQNEDVSPVVTDAMQNVTTNSTDDKNKDNRDKTQQKTIVSKPSVQNGQTSSDNNPSLRDIPVTASDDKTPASSDAKVANNPSYNPAPKPSVTDCSVIKITGDASVKESCKDENTGNIVVHLNSIKGGTKPYKFSVTSEDDFTTASLFDQLKAGTYKLYAKDANGCISVLKELTVESKDCFNTTDIFYPERGQEWSLPLKNNADAKLQIFNRAGAMVYTINISNGYPNTWNGTDNGGQLLPMGNYSYRLHYDDQSITSGNVTIAR